MTDKLEQTVTSLRSSIRKWMCADAAYSAFADAGDPDTEREFPILSCIVRGDNDQPTTVELDPNKLPEADQEEFARLCSVMITADYTQELAAVSHYAAIGSAELTRAS